jgi:hypothetical protein
MTRVTLDAVASSKPHQLGEPVELCDPSGKVLGRFVPALDPTQWGAVTPEASEEELSRREQSVDWHSTEEVLARLGHLEP